MDKTYFFDIDGTLSVPMYEFPEKENMCRRCCLPSEKWESFASGNKDAYKDCKVLPQIREFLKDLQNQGATLVVLSVEDLEGVKVAKNEFIESNFEGVFKEITYVNHANEKVSEIEKYAFCNKIPIESCYLVDDTLSILIKAGDVGINPIHITDVVYTYTPKVVLRRKRGKQI